MVELEGIGQSKENTGGKRWHSMVFPSFVKIVPIRKDQFQFQCNLNKQDWKFQSIARDNNVKIEKMDKIRNWNLDKNLKNWLTENGQKLKFGQKLEIGQKSEKLKIGQKLKDWTKIEKLDKKLEN